MISGYDFVKGPHQNVEWLIEQTDCIFDTKIVPKGGATKAQATKDKMVEHRGWKPALPIIRKNLDIVIADLGVFYVPKFLQPGPGFIFPQIDIHGNIKAARFRPLYDLEINGQASKYAQLGVKSKEFQGPTWLGNTPGIVQRIIETRTAILVEGYFDIIAARLVAPNAPIISKATKGLSSQHVAYLRMLGVERVYTMLDNEAAKGEKAEGAGNQAMRSLAEKLPFRTESLLCPAEDPSACLKDYSLAVRLQRLLSRFN